MAEFDANLVVNGLYGFVYDENGKELQGTQEFEVKIELTKAPVKIAGKLVEANKVTGAKVTGKYKQFVLDTRLAKKIAENPTGKYNFIGKLADPTAAGQEAVLLKGVSFNGTVLLGFKTGDLVERDYDFTVDDYQYLDSID